MSTEINVFTDGSTLNNQSKELRKGGVGVWFGENDSRNISIPLTDNFGTKVTNQVAELIACTLAIDTILSTEKIEKLIEKIIIITFFWSIRQVLGL